MKLWKLAGLSPLLCIALLGCGKDQGSGPAYSDCSPSAIPLAANNESDVATTAQIHPMSFSPGSGRFIVKMKPLVEGEIRANSIPAHAKPTLERIDENWRVVEVKDGGDTTALVHELMNMEGVESVEPDFLIHTASTFTPNDPGFSRQWSHQKVKSAAAWGMSQGSERVVVAIIDGGVEITHPDLAANIWRNPRETRNGRDDDGNGYVDDIHGWDFIGNDPDPKADTTAHIHGTHVAGIVGAVGNNGKGIVGHAPNVRLMSLKYIGSNGSGLTSHAIRAIDYAVRNGAHIINASWSTTSYSQALYDAIARARAAGVLVVAAAGNDGINIDKTPRYPASFGLDNIVAVGASTNSDGFASFSNSGVKSVDVVAPGTSIYSTRTGAAYSLLGGTSMATPLVTGIAALVKARHSSFNYQKIAGALFLGVDRFAALSSRVRFGGRVNAHKTLIASDDLANGKAILSQAMLCPGS